MIQGRITQDGIALQFIKFGFVTGGPGVKLPIVMEITISDSVSYVYTVYFFTFTAFRGFLFLFQDNKASSKLA